MIKYLFSVLKFLMMALTLLVLAALSYRVIMFKGTVREPMPLSESAVIDMHVHIAGLGYGDSGCFISPDMKRSFKFEFYLKAFGVTADKLKAEGDQLLVRRLVEMLAASDKVDGAVILAMDGVVDDQGQLDYKKTQVFIPNRYVAEQAALYPEIFFGASINPYRQDALARLEKVKRQGAKLIKWIPSIQHIDPADRKLIPFYQAMKRLDLPLLTHTGQERSFATSVDEYADPNRLELPLSLGLTVIAAHIATTGSIDGQDNFQRILPMFARYPNLYGDISSLTQMNKLGYLDQALMDERLEGRLLYGSDFPLVNMVLVSSYYFPLNLTLSKMMKISSLSNPWDRDVALKQALGVPADIFALSARLLKIQPQAKR